MECIPIPTIYVLMAIFQYHPLVQHHSAISHLNNTIFMHWGHLGALSPYMNDNFIQLAITFRIKHPSFSIMPLTHFNYRCYN